jgi:hypothetical protein
MKRLSLCVVALVVLGGCAQPAQQSGRPEANPERYARDRDFCRTQADDIIKSRRGIDDSRREVFAGDRDRYGQGTLPAQMDAYGDTRSADRMISDCMAARGWSQPTQNWWQRLRI